MSKVPVQKGAIIADVPTMKHMTVQEKNREDGANAALRRSGQTLSNLTPKRK